MSIKPVGSIRVDVDGAELRLSEELPKGKVSLYYIPDTHRIVPVEPTRAMCKAATSYTHSHDAKLIYKAMLAAAKEKEE